MNITKRLNQIIEKSYEYDTSPAGVVLTKEQLAFIAGAIWADKTMIEKACEWLYVYYPNIAVHGIDKVLDMFKEEIME